MNIQELFKKADSAMKSGNFAEARGCLNSILEEHPTNRNALYGLAFVLYREQSYPEAVLTLEKLLSEDPQSPQLLSLLGAVYISLDRLSEAEKALNTVQVQERNYEIFFQLGRIAQKKGALIEAIDFYSKTVALNPEFTGAYINLGSCYREQGEFEKSTDSFNKAISLSPNNIFAHFNSGNQYFEMGEYEKALKRFQACLSLDNNFAEAYSNIGNIYLEWKRIGEAEKYYLRATELNPKLAEARAGLGRALFNKGDLKNCFSAYTEALELDSENITIQSTYCFALNSSADHSRAEIYKAHLDYGQLVEKKEQSVKEERKFAPAGDRIRIGYLSPDFRNHPGAFFLGPLLKNHNREKFEVFSYSDVVKEDFQTERLKKYSDNWRDVNRLSHQATCDLILNDKIDILIDAAGHTARNRLPVFAKSSAPVQITYFGYPNTTGLPTIDYRIVDKTSAPEEEQDYNSEELIYLPDCFLCYEAPEDSPEISNLPAEDNGYVTFGCFNRLSKIDEELISIWSQLLSEVEGSKLIIKCPELSDNSVKQYLSKKFTAHGLTEERLMLRGGTSQEEHLDSYGTIDIALDSFPYSGTTTTCEALWMGVPVITFKGERFATRVSASLLGAAGLSEFIAVSKEEYIKKAINLAASIDDLAQLRKEMRGKLRDSVLFDTTTYTRKLEELFEKVCLTRL